MIKEISPQLVSVDAIRLSHQAIVLAQQIKRVHFQPVSTSAWGNFSRRTVVRMAGLRAKSRVCASVLS
jgi:hypothetical protein